MLAIPRRTQDPSKQLGRQKCPIPSGKILDAPYLAYIQGVVQQTHGPREFAGSVVES